MYFEDFIKTLKDVSNTLSTIVQQSISQAESKTGHKFSDDEIDDIIRFIVILAFAKCVDKKELI